MNVAAAKGRIMAPRCIRKLLLVDFAACTTQMKKVTALAKANPLATPSNAVHCAYRAKDQGQPRFQLKGQ